MPYSDYFSSSNKDSFLHEFGANKDIERRLMAELIRNNKLNSKRTVLSETNYNKIFRENETER